MKICKKDPNCGGGCCGGMVD